MRKINIKISLASKKTLSIVQKAASYFLYRRTPLLLVDFLQCPRPHWMLENPRKCTTYMT
jgi:hypothetical protein